MLTNKLTNKKMIAAAVLSALFAGASLAATSMTEKQITDKALALQAGTVQHAKMEKKAGKEVWEVAIRDSAGKDHTLYFNAATGAEMHFDRYGKETKG